MPRWLPDRNCATTADDGAAASGTSDSVGACCGGTQVTERNLEIAHARALALALTAAAYGDEPIDEARINRKRGYADARLS